jgi:hypothetical protein
VSGRITSSQNGHREGREPEIDGGVYSVHADTLLVDVRQVRRAVRAECSFDLGGALALIRRQLMILDSASHCSDRFFKSDKQSSQISLTDFFHVQVFADQICLN